MQLADQLQLQHQLQLIEGNMGEVVERLRSSSILEYLASRHCGPVFHLASGEGVVG